MLHQEQKYFHGYEADFNNSRIEPKDENLHIFTMKRLSQIGSKLHNKISSLDTKTFIASKEKLN